MLFTAVCSAPIPSARSLSVQLCKSDSFVGAGIAYQYVWESPTERNIGPLTAEPPKNPSTILVSRAHHVDAADASRGDHGTGSEGL